MPAAAGAAAPRTVKGNGRLSAPGGSDGGPRTSPLEATLRRNAFAASVSPAPQRRAGQQLLAMLVFLSLACSPTTTEPADAFVADSAVVDSAREVADSDASKPCDASGYCCCDKDVVARPTCSDGRLTCPPLYTLMTEARCSSDCSLSRPTRQRGRVK
jgi:hypothetical protein